MIVAAIFAVAGVLCVSAHKWQWLAQRAPGACPRSVHSTSSATLTRLSTHADVTIRENVAANRHTPAHVLAQLACDPYPLVRHNVARNPSTDTLTLRGLSHDQHPGTRGHVDKVRRTILAAHIATLTGPARDHGNLLLPTFTGWPDQLDAVLATVTSPERNIDDARQPSDPTPTPVHPDTP